MLQLTITSKLCGGNLTTEAYRWDERLFSLMLCLPGMPSSQDLSAAFVRPSLSALCEATGGKSYVVTSLRMLNQSIESLVQKLHPGVVIRFEKMEGSYLQAVTNDTGEWGCSISCIDIMLFLRVCPLFWLLAVHLFVSPSFAFVELNVHFGQNGQMAAALFLLVDSSAWPGDLHHQFASTVPS